MFPGLELQSDKQELYLLRSSVPETDRIPDLKHGIIFWQNDRWQRGIVHDVTPANSSASTFTTTILLQPAKRQPKKTFITMQLGPDNFGSEVADGQIWFKVVDKSLGARDSGYMEGTIC